MVRTDCRLTTLTRGSHQARPTAAVARQYGTPPPPPSPTPRRLFARQWYRVSRTALT